MKYLDKENWEKLKEANKDPLDLLVEYYFKMYPDEDITRPAVKNALILFINITRGGVSNITIGEIINELNFKIK